MKTFLKILQTINLFLGTVLYCVFLFPSPITDQNVINGFGIGAIICLLYFICFEIILRKRKDYDGTRS
jgi:hypothetical protein